ncbi:tRNA (guanine(37)-N1)-methyltransferase [Thalictrum thalictroides]|uniref:tRNA (guanine(37)-N1)-methyltransferase n=1 Tax=Thalictrum thalictroides TaxID=46969 RepID=A0A7J6W5N5_THATH|nr:tRNA (guanine(37)-N1)-methyltransferase [Thalictrum thalictroides]
MVTKLVFRFHPPLFAIFSANRFLRKPLVTQYSLLLPSSTSSSTLFINQDYCYGPSLDKGKKPFQSSHQQDDLSQASLVFVNDGEEDPLFDKESFSRVFDIAAIKVPAEDCFALENQLRGHLLNWPRIRNIVRVRGDEMEENFKKMLPENVTEGDEDEKFDALNRRIYGKTEGDGEALSPVLYRDKLVKSFNTRGFVKFRNLAKISRPKKTRKMVVEGDKHAREKRTGKNSISEVEVIGDRDSDGDDMTGLLGEEFKGGRWRGATRLLLLDEEYANKDVGELPEAIKLLFSGDGKHSRSCQLVKCRLTLFYDYWQMNDILEALLPNGIIVPAAFEMVGHIAHLNLRDEHLPYKNIIAQVVLDKHKTKIKTVVNKIESIQNDYRTMQLEVLAGNHSLATTVVENGFRFHLDLGTVYWNSRLATERQRLVNRFTNADIVCDVFSGVGPLAIAAAKKVKHVYANDLNPSAVEYLERNCVLNKLERKITVYKMDGRRFIDAIFKSQKTRYITQVVMNLPNDAAEFLDAFRGIFNNRPRAAGIPMPMINVYGFSKAEDPEFDFHQRIRTALLEFAVEVEMHRVRDVAPGKWMLCASFVLPESVAYANQS